MFSDVCKPFAPAYVDQLVYEHYNQHQNLQNVLPHFLHVHHPLHYQLLQPENRLFYFRNI